MRVLRFVDGCANGYVLLSYRGGSCGVHFCLCALQIFAQGFKSSDNELESDFGLVGKRRLHSRALMNHFLKIHRRF